MKWALLPLLIGIVWVVCRLAFSISWGVVDLLVRQGFHSEGLPEWGVLVFISCVGSLVTSFAAAKTAYVAAPIRSIWCPVAISCLQIGSLVVVALLPVEFFRERQLSILRLSMELLFGALGSLVVVVAIRLERVKKAGVA